MKTLALAAILLSAQAFARPAAASDMARLARELGRAARAAGLKRVAVFRFKPASGSETAGGAALSEALLVELVRDGRVSAVDRSLASAAVDGVVVGHYQAAGRRLRVFARVVRLADRRVVRAGRAEVEISDASPAPDPLDAVASVLRGDFAPDADEDLKDALAAIKPDCADAAERVGRLQAPLVALKARYRAFRLRLGEGAARGEPSAIAPLTPEELARLDRGEKDSSALARECGL